MVEFIDRKYKYIIYITGQERSFGAVSQTCTEESYSLLNLQQKDKNIYPATYICDMTNA